MANRLTLIACGNLLQVMWDWISFACHPGTKGCGITWDVFVSRASADKDAFVRPLVAALEQRGICCWVEEHAIEWADSIAMKIN